MKERMREQEEEEKKWVMKGEMVELREREETW